MHSCNFVNCGEVVFTFRLCQGAETLQKLFDVCGKLHCTTTNMTLGLLYVSPRPPTHRYIIRRMAGHIDKNASGSEGRGVICSLTTRICPQQRV